MGRGGLLCTREHCLFWVEGGGGKVVVLAVSWLTTLMKCVDNGGAPVGGAIARGIEEDGLA